VPVGWGLPGTKAAGKETEIPLRVTMKEVPVETITVFVVRAGVFYLLRQRPEKGLLPASYYAIERKNKNEQKNERKILRLFFVRFLLKWYRRKFVYYQEAHCERIKDTLKTLELYKDGEGFTVAAELLADQNSFSGIDMIRFGDSINILLDRELHERESILTQYDAALSMYRKYYQYEQINGSERETVILIPEAAYREAVANALVHRTWDVETNIHVEMFPDKIEITSPGGLPQGVTKEEYLRGGLSVLRNRIIGNLFFRLHLIERFGTGIRRIKESYKDNDRKPIFEVFENSIKIMLPVMDACNALTADENRIYLLIKRKALPSSSLVEETGFGKTKVVSILRRLMDKGYVQSVGNGRGTKYTAEAIK